MTDENGAKIETTEYMPFGSQRSHWGTNTSDYRFTDQELDAENGLYNYNARLYDPFIGRFISADTIIPEPFNPQSLNRYSYCLNNPLIYIDPNGHTSEDSSWWNNFIDIVGRTFRWTINIIGDIFGSGNKNTNDRGHTITVGPLMDNEGNAYGNGNTFYVGGGGSSAPIPQGGNSGAVSNPVGNSGGSSLIDKVINAINCAFSNYSNIQNERISIQYKWTIDFIGGATDFMKNYYEMREANTIGADKYFHAKANFEAASRGPGGEFFARHFSNLREIWDQNVKGYPRSDTLADQAANIWGRSQVVIAPDGRSAAQPYRPNGLTVKY
jgi:RHS repeat-associated protein